MNTHDMLYLILTTISISISIFSLFITYFANFRKAKLKIVVGSNIIISNSYTETISEKIWGGVTFLIPITFCNWSPSGGHIYKVRLIIGRETEPNLYFDLEWSSFVKFIDGIQWEDETVALPISLSGKDSISKFVRFDWSPPRLNQEKGFKIVEGGRYELILLIWTRESYKPNAYQKFYFTITKENFEVFQKTIQNNDTFGIWIPIDDTRNTNRVITRTNMKQEYLK